MPVARNIWPPAAEFAHGRPDISECGLGALPISRRHGILGHRGHRRQAYRGSAGVGAHATAPAPGSPAPTVSAFPCPGATAVIVDGAVIRIRVVVIRKAVEAGVMRPVP